MLTVSVDWRSRKDTPTEDYYVKQVPAGGTKTVGSITSDFLYANTNNLCGPKTYTLMMADKVTPNQNTTYLNLVNQGTVSAPDVVIQVYTINPVYFTNAQVTYYLRTTLDNYVYRYPVEAQRYESMKLNMRNCIVESFNIANWVRPQRYILYTPVEKYPYTQWTQQPLTGTAKTASPTTCGYTINY